jgi:hypothetical protein
MNRLWRLVALTLLVVAIGSHPLAAAPARATVNQAGLVVRYADGSTTYAWVTFAEDEISGLELLRRSGLSLVTTPFGPLGEAVCRIGDSGCDVAECGSNLCQSSADAPYWQYFRQKAGDWQTMMFGASGTKVRDGDVDAWEWTAGDATLPALDLATVRALAGVDGGTAAATPVVRSYTAAGVVLAATVVDRGAATSALAGGAAIAGLAGAAVWVTRRTRQARAHP